MMKLIFLLSLIFSTMHISVMSHDEDAEESSEPSMIANISSENAARKDSTDSEELELQCSPKVPLIEPLYAAGLVGNSSRLPTKLKERLKNSKKEQRKNQLLLTCRHMANLKEGEYVCKSKRLNYGFESRTDSDGRVDDYEIDPAIEDYY